MVFPGFSNRQIRESTGEDSRSRGQERRAVITSRAVAMASVEGLEALTVGRLATKLGMSKSGLFAHFGSVRRLQLATIERAGEIFAAHVVLPAEAKPEGVARLWALCDNWLKHIEDEVFPGGFLFVGAFFEYGHRSGQIADRIRKVVRQWFDFLRQGVQKAQKLGEIDSEINPARLAQELNGLLLGAYWTRLLGDEDVFSQARESILKKLGASVTEEVPTSAFKSVKSWSRYLRDKNG